MAYRKLFPLLVLIFLFQCQREKSEMNNYEIIAIPLPKLEPNEIWHPTFDSVPVKKTNRIQFF